MFAVAFNFSHNDWNYNFYLDYDVIKEFSEFFEV